MKKFSGPAAGDLDPADPAADPGFARSVLVELDARGAVITTNAAWEQLRERLPDLGLDLMLAPLADEIEQVLADGTPRNSEIKLPPIGPHPSLVFDCLLSRSGSGGEARIKVAFTDITEARRQAEIASQADPNHWRDFAEATSEGILIHHRGLILDANPQFAEMFAYPLGDLGKTRILDLIAPQSLELVRRRLLWPRPGIYQALGLKKDGSTFPIELRSPQESRAPAGEDRPQILAIRDITEWKKTETQLTHAAKLATIGELAVGIAHELNQPLAVIKFAAEGSLRDMAKGVLSREEWKSRFELIDGVSGRMAELINHMGAFSRQDSGEIERFDPLAAVASAVRLVEAEFRSQDIRISPNLPAGRFKVLGHPMRLEQVVLNLLTNARDSIRAKRESLGPEANNWSAAIDLDSAHDAAARMLTIYVTDNGLGLSEDGMERIFDPFYTTKPAGEGMGLGLSISSGIISAMSGRLGVAPRDGGARFEITLPCEIDRAVD